MPGMWELPHLTADSVAAEKPLLVLRHAIMQTNYRVAVVACSQPPAAVSLSGKSQQWIGVDDLPGLPLTGLARKILLRVGMLARR